MNANIKFIESLPADFIKRMNHWLGNEADEFYEALSRQVIGIRLNPFRGSLGFLRSMIPWGVQNVPWCHEGLTLNNHANVGAHIYHKCGVYYIQDPSAMAAGYILDPKPGEWVLDMCAAPGGKTTHLAAEMKGEGVLVANEIVAHRAIALELNIERMGIKNTVITNEYPDRLANKWPDLFDAVLVDAPCSGEGMFSKSSQSILDWSIEAIRGNSRRQKKILDQSASLLRPGGRLLYCTCTYSPEENEGVVVSFLQDHRDFKLQTLPEIPFMQSGRPDWVNGPEFLVRCGRLWPHKAKGYGHFFALFRKEGKLIGQQPSRWPENNVPRSVKNHFLKFRDETLTQAFYERGLLLTKNKDLFYVQMNPSYWSPLRVLRPGLRIGSMPYKVFVPDHALAMTLRPNDVRRTIAIDPNDDRLEKYLEGNNWIENDFHGHILITVNGFPIGWAKSGGGRVRSKYPSYLRNYSYTFE